MTTKTFSLTVGERVKALGVLGTFKGNIDTHAFAMDDAKVLSVTQEEWKTANLVKTPTDEEIKAIPAEERKSVSQTWKWDETVIKDVELHSAVVDFIVAAVKEKSDKNEIALDESQLISLYKKLTA